MQKIKKMSLLGTVRDEIDASVRLFFQPIGAVVNAVSAALKQRIAPPQTDGPEPDRRQTGGKGVPRPR